MRLAGAVALVTGAANGLGRGVALALARRGVELELIDKDGPALDAAGDAARASGSPAVRTACLDLRETARLSAWLAGLPARRPALALVVLCAGIAQSGSVQRSSDEELEELLAVNFLSSARIVRATLPLLRAEGGRIAGVLSPFATLGFPGKSGYAASKFALRGFLESLAAELAGTNVGVTCFYPGAIATDIARRGLSDDPERVELEHRFLERRGQPPERVAEALVRAVERDRSRALCGHDARLLDATARWSPLTARLVAAHAARRPPFDR